VAPARRVEEHVAPPGCDDCRRSTVRSSKCWRARRCQRMLESGEYGTLAELAAAEWISRSYVCRVLRLALLASDIVERILDGQPTAGLAQFLKPFPVEWERQRDRLL
jgi:hypothetical protein